MKIAALSVAALTAVLLTLPSFSTADSYSLVMPATGLVSGGDFSDVPDVGFGNSWNSGNTTRSNFLWATGTTFGGLITAAGSKDYEVYHDMWYESGTCSPAPTTASAGSSLQCGLGIFINTKGGLTVTDPGSMLAYTNTDGTALWAPATKGTAATYAIKITDNDICRVLTVALATDGKTNSKIADGACAEGDDATAPTVTIKGAPAIVSSTAPFGVTAQFSEDVTGFESAEIGVTGAATSNFTAVDGNTFTADITPNGTGDITLDIAANVAQDKAGNDNTAASQVSLTYDATAPTVTIMGPTDVVTSDFTVTMTFSEDVTGFVASDVTVTNGTKGNFSAFDMTYTLVITPELGATVSVSVAAGQVVDAGGNGNEASDVLEVQAGSPASEFAANEAEIRQVIVDDARRSLNSTLASNHRLSSEARTRFITSRRQMAGDGAGIASRNKLEFDLNGTAEVTLGGADIAGSFFEQSGNFEGTYRRLFFGDFDVQNDTDTGSTTATLSSKIAWEHMVSEQTMLGYYIGGELGRSQIDGTLKGDQSSYGVSVGSYFVSALQENMFADGFVSLGVGRKDLEMGNGSLDLQSDYITRTLTVGAALTGVIEQEGFEIWPELAFTYGKTFIGDVDFTGRAYGLVDNDLSLDAGDVSIVNLTLRPEFRIPMDDMPVADSLSLFTFAPRVRGALGRSPAAQAVRHRCVEVQLPGFCKPHGPPCQDGLRQGFDAEHGIFRHGHTALAIGHAAGSGPNRLSVVQEHDDGPGHAIGFNPSRCRF